METLRMTSFFTSIQAKIARTDIADAKANLAVAQSVYDAEVKTYKEYEAALSKGFHDGVPMTKFLELRELKRMQARVMREAFNVLVRAMTAIDDAESKYDLLVASQYK